MQSPQITTQLQQAFTQAEKLPAQDMEVNVQDGIVTLNGTAP
ncbi:MAG: BON domain-containing protein [Bacteroidota bacterium]